jgi:phage gpG-like protein
MARTVKDFGVRLRRLGKLVGDLRDPLGDIADEAILDIEQGIDDGVDIDDNPFKPLSKAYARQKARKFPNKVILKRTNSMVAGGNIKVKVNKKSVSVTYNSPHAQYHQFGTATMPRREFVGIRDETSTKADKILGDFIDRLLKATL